MYPFTEKYIKMSTSNYQMKAFSEEVIFEVHSRIFKIHVDDHGRRKVPCVIHVVNEINLDISRLS